MSLRSFLVLVGLLLVPATAGAVTVHEIIELTKAGLSDEVLTALIDADRTIFTLDKDQILELKEAGVSKAVLLKMLRSRREFDSPPPAPASEPASEPPATASADDVPGIVIIGAQPAPPPPPAVVVQYYVPFPLWGGARNTPQIAAPFLPDQHRGFGRFINDGWIAPRK
jgi:hypothetical protein